MKYIKVNWKHDSKEQPVILYSELDDSNWEKRKVEIFMDGHSAYADKDTNPENKTLLGLEPLPSFEEINKDPQFELVEITKEEFEEVWYQAKGNKL